MTLKRNNPKTDRKSRSNDVADPVTPADSAAGAVPGMSTPDGASTSIPNGDRPSSFEVTLGGRRLGEMLVDSELVSATQLREALLQQGASGKRVGNLLVELGALDERDLASILADQFELEKVDLRSRSPLPEAVLLLPEAVARSVNAVPLGEVSGHMEVAVADPSDHLRQVLAETMGVDVRLLVAPATDIRRAIDNSYRALSGVGRYVAAFEASSESQEAAAAVVSTATADATTADAPVVQVVNLMITQALRDRASDIHVEPQDRRVRIRFRIDGALHDTLSLPSSMAQAVVSRIKIMANMNIVERRRPQDGQFSLDVDGRQIDVRVSTTAVVWGEKCVMRILDKSRPLYRLADLGMPEETHETYAKIIRSPFGMVLCAGPTGSGKTTTLYATLSEINEPYRNITTIEDPVEYVFPSINQISTNEQAGLTFADGLKSILRQDPDVILVGEIRDVDTARIAIQAALTGHFVLSSLHGTDSVAALHRFLDMGIESFLIASSVVAVVGQRLVRRICTACRVPYKPTDEEMAFYDESGGVAKDQFWQGEGCNFCAGSGYQDRIGVYELLRVTPEMKRLLVGWATQDELRRLAVQQGMRPLRQEALALVEQDVTTIAEVIRSIYTL